MDDRKPESLLTVINSGSLSRAAAELDYTHPTLSQMINNLDRELGCRLPERGHRGIALTLEGKSLLPYIKDCVNTAVRLRSVASQISAQQQQIIRIGEYPSITQSWLSTIIKEFQQHRSGISIKLQVGGYDIQRWLRTGAIDLEFWTRECAGTIAGFPCRLTHISQSYQSAVRSARKVPSAWSSFWSILSFSLI